MSSVLLLEPFYAGSHKTWADQLIKNSNHPIDLLSLKGKFWKWRMHGAAIELAKQVKENYDLFLVSDMIDLPLFKSLLTDENKNKPIVLYFHENQLAYPWTENKKDWDRAYAWKNYSSALVADQVCFNSHFNKQSFLDALPKFLSAFPDHQNLQTVEQINEKSMVLPLGLELSDFDKLELSKINDLPIVLWNHRWEHDKNPELFFKTLIRLKKEGLRFHLIVLGEAYPNKPEIFDLAKAELSFEILHWGFVEKVEDYINFLWMSDVLPVTSQHDFFGLSVLEATYCQTTPLLPNRLAYPEHFDDSSIFYNTDEEFYSKLKFLLENRLPFDQKLKEQIKKYDWKKMFLHYDDLISQLSN